MAIYCGTVVLSIIVEFIIQKGILRQLLIKECKIKENYNLKLIMLFIAGLNMVVVLEDLLKYYFIRENKFNLTSLSDFEKTKVKENKSNIFRIIQNQEILPTHIVIYNEKGNENIIYYTIKNNKKIITNTKGKIKKYSKIRKYRILNEQLNELNFVEKFEPTKSNIFNTNYIYTPYIKNM